MIKKRIKNWIIRKLGGIVYDDLSPKIKREMMYEATQQVIKMAQNSMDQEVADILHNAFECDYTRRAVYGMKCIDPKEYRRRVMGDFSV